MKRRFSRLLWFIALLAATLLPSAAGAESLSSIVLNREHQGSFAKGNQTVYYLMSVPQDGLIRLSAQTDGQMDAGMFVVRADSGPSYQEGIRISGTGYSSDKQLWDTAFGGSLGVNVGPYHGRSSDSIVFTLTAGTYKFMVTNWGCDKGGSYKFTVGHTPARWVVDPEPNDTAAQALQVSLENWHNGHLKYNGLTDQNKTRDETDYYRLTLPEDRTLQFEYGDDEYLGARFTIADQSGNIAYGEMFDQQTGSTAGTGSLVFGTAVSKYTPPEQRSYDTKTAKFTLGAGTYYLKVEELKNLGGEYRFRLSPAAAPVVQQPPVNQPPLVIQPPSYTDSSPKKNDIAIKIDNREIQPDVPPQVISGRTMVPIRFVAQALNCQVDWFEPAKTVIITSPGSYKPNPPANYTGQIVIMVNGSLLYPDVPPQLISGRTMVPVRFVAEALGAGVNWDDATQTVIISSTGQPAPEGSTMVSPPLVGTLMDSTTQRLFERRVDPSGNTVLAFTDRSQPVNAGAPEIDASIFLEKAVAGQKYKAVLDYNYGQSNITSDDLLLPSDGSGFIGFSFTRPTGSWPTGRYEVKVFLNGVFRNSTVFTIE